MLTKSGSSLLAVAAALSDKEDDEAQVLAAVQRTVLYDRNGDLHYDLISALHKSMHGALDESSSCSGL